MKGRTTHTFTPDDYRNIDTVITALRELDMKRLKAHELLETETIRASALRHRLANFPHKLKAELTALVASARESNVAQMQALQSELNEICEKGTESEKRIEVLQLHNDVLEPEQKKTALKHNELVKKVNACMSRKTKMQIRLNETREMLQNTNTEISGLEDGMCKLAEDMHQARKEFASDKQNLMDELEETKSKHQRQMDENRKIGGKLETLQDETVQTALIVSDKQKALVDVEGSIRRLLALEGDLKTRLQAGVEKTKELQRACVKVEKEIKEMREDYANKKETMLEKTRLAFKKEEERSSFFLNAWFKREIVLASEESKRLLGVQKGLRRDVKQAQEGSTMQARALKATQEDVSSSKKTLQYQAEEGARLDSENKELQFRLAQLKENHTVNVQVLKDEMTDLKESLTKESKTRQAVEDSYNDLQSQIEESRVQHAASMTLFSSKMEEAKKQNNNMSDRSIILEHEIEEQEKAIALTKQQLRSARAKLERTNNSLTEQIDMLEQNIADLKEEVEDRNETLKDVEPKCDEMEVDFKEKDTHYEKRKKEIIALKSKRSGLEDHVKQIDRELEKIHIPQDKLRMDTLRCRAYTRQRLRKQCQEVSSIEERVVQAHQKLLAINNENKRIEQASRKLEEETARLTTLFECGGEIEENLEAALKKYRENLMKQWKANDEMEKCSSSRDRVVLQDITSLKDASESRLEMIATVHDQFEKELEEFTNYLDIAARTSKTLRT